MNKQTIKLNEDEFNKLVQECIKSVLNEEENEGFLRNMIQGYRQGRQDYKAAQQPYKDATRQAKADSKQANQTAKKYGRYVEKDLQAINDILNHYQDYPQIAKSARLIQGALGNLRNQMNQQASNAQQAYQSAKSQQATNKQQLDANMTQNFRNTFSGQPQQQPYGQTAE